MLRAVDSRCRLYDILLKAVTVTFAI